MTHRPGLDLVYAAERNPEAWEARHAAGEVPSRWPYGLDALSAFAETTVIPLAAPGRLTRALSRLPVSRPRSTAVADRVALAWDENIARRMLSSKLPDARRFSGLIWLTDRPDPDSPEVARLTASLRALDGIFVLSSGQLDAVERLLPGGPPVTHVPFGVDHEFFSAAPYPERPLVLSVGGDRDRDPETLFTALEIVHASAPDVDLVVQTSSTATPPDGVTVLAKVTHRELRDLYARASLVAIATRPNLHVSGMTVSLEAMASGRPVVLTDSPGAADYVEDGVTGLLVPQRAPAELANAILGLLQAPHDAERLGVSARTTVEARFTTAQLAARLAAFMHIA